MAEVYNSTQYYDIVWDTRYRVSGSATNAVMPVAGSAINISRIQVMELEMYNSWYAINSLNNILDFNDGANQQAIIPPGNYNRTTFPVALKAAMEFVSALTFTITIDQATGLLFIGATGPFSLLFATGAAAPPPTSKSYTLDKVMGFPRADTAVAAAVFGSYPVNLSGENYLYFTSSLIKGRDNAMIPAGNTDITAAGNGVFHRTQLYSVQTAITATYEPGRPIVINARTTNFDIQVRYNDGNIVDLNGFDYSMKVRIYYS